MRMRVPAAGKAISSAYGMDIFAATGRFRRWHQAGVITADGREGAGGETAAYLFSPETVAAVTVMFAIFDRAAIQDSERMKALFAYLTGPGPEGRLIDLILLDIAVGGEPVLWLTQWIGPEDARQTSFSTRLSDELDWPIIAPGDGWEPIFYGKIDLRPLLIAFTGANVVPMHANPAVN